VLNVHVSYWITNLIDEKTVSRLERELSFEEVERAGRFRFASDRRDFVAAHSLLRQMLSRFGDRQPREWSLQSGSHGKPALSGEHGTDLVFNLTHTRGLVACAIARQTTVGIDVEWVNRSADVQNVSERCFSEDEQRMLAACPSEARPDRFTELWTLKEAVVKAVGTGMPPSLDRWSFRFVGDTDIRLNGTVSDRADWQCVLAAPTPDHRLALAVRCAPGRQPYRVWMQNFESIHSQPLEPLRESRR
jgi:4'-phosphopantetheinyl transferase